MTTQTSDAAPRRAPLSRELVLETAVRLADRGGLEALSMRKLGQELGVEAMAIYYHFPDKEAVIDGMIDLVFREVDLPADDGDWVTAMRRRSVSLRDALLRHRWSIGLAESRRHPGPATLGQHDAVLGSLFAGGLSTRSVAMAASVLDAYVYGFALTKLNLPFESSEEVADVAASMLAAFPADEYPHLVTFMTEYIGPGYDYGDEFESGLDLILGALERAAGAADASRPARARRRAR